MTTETTSTLREVLARALLRECLLQGHAATAYRFRLADAALRVFSEHFDAERRRPVIESTRDERPQTGGDRS